MPKTDQSKRIVDDYDDGAMNYRPRAFVHDADDGAMNYRARAFVHDADDGTMNYRPRAFVHDTDDGSMNYRTRGYSKTSNQLPDNGFNNQEEPSLWTRFKQYCSAWRRYIVDTPKYKLLDDFMMCFVLSLDDTLTPARSVQVFLPDLFAKYISTPIGIVILISAFFASIFKFIWFVHTSVGFNAGRNIDFITKGLTDEESKQYRNTLDPKDLNQLHRELNMICDDAGFVLENERFGYQFQVPAPGVKSNKHALDLTLVRKPLDQKSKPVVSAMEQPRYTFVEKFVHAIYSNAFVKNALIPAWNWLSFTSFVYWVFWYGTFLAFSSLYAMKLISIPAAMSIVGISTATLGPVGTILAVAGVILLPFVIGTLFYLAFQVPHIFRSIRRENLDTSDKDWNIPTPLERMLIVKQIAQMYSLKKAAEKILGGEFSQIGEKTDKKSLTQISKNIKLRLGFIDAAPDTKKRYVFRNDDSDDDYDPRFDDISKRPLRDETSAEYRKSRVRWAGIKGFLSGFVVTNFIVWLAFVALEGLAAVGSIALAKFGVISAATAATYAIGATPAWIIGLGLGTAGVSISALPFTGLCVIALIGASVLVGAVSGIVYAVDMSRTIKKRDALANANSSVEIDGLEPETSRNRLTKRAEALANKQKLYLEKLATVRKLAEKIGDQELIKMLDQLPRQKDIDLTHFKENSPAFTNEFNRNKPVKFIAGIMTQLTEPWNAMRRMFSGMLLIRFTILTIVPALFLTVTPVAAIGAFSLSVPLVGVVTVPGLLVGLAVLGAAIGFAWWWMESSERALQSNVYELTPEALQLRHLELKAQEDIMERLEREVVPPFDAVIAKNERLTSPQAASTVKISDRLKKLPVSTATGLASGVSTVVSSSASFLYHHGTTFLGYGLSLFAKPAEVEMQDDGLGYFSEREKIDLPDDTGGRGYVY